MKAREQGYGSLPGSAYTIAKAHASRGETEKAIEWLQRAIDARFDDRPDLKNNLAFASMRSNPRFPRAGRFLARAHIHTRTGMAVRPGLLPGGSQTPSRGAGECFQDCGIRKRSGGTQETNRGIDQRANCGPTPTDHGDARRRSHGTVSALPAAKVRFKTIPLDFYFFSDGLFVINAAEPYAKLIGKKVVAIGGRSTDNLLEDLRSYVSRDNDQGLRWLGPRYLGVTNLLQAMGYSDTPDFAILKVAASDGTREDVQVAAGGYLASRKLSPPIGTSEDAVPLWLRNVSENYWHAEMPKLDGLYVQFNQVRNKDGESISEYAKTLKGQLKTTQARNLILDLRHNNGGNNFLIWPLVRLARAPRDVRAGSSCVRHYRAWNLFGVSELYQLRRAHDQRCIRRRTLELPAEFHR